MAEEQKPPDQRQKPCDHLQVEERDGKKYCKKCKGQLYL
jgi:hypothetical protein